MKEDELIIKAVEIDGKISVEINGNASNKILIVILHDVIEQLYNRTTEHILSVKHE